MGGGGQLATHWHFALASQSSFVSINRNKNRKPITVIFFTIGLYIYELIK